MLFAITECSAPQDARDHFDRVQDERDGLGEDVTGMLSIDPDTTRFPVEDNGTEFYAARTTSSDAMYVLGKRPSSDPGWEELADHFWKNES